jgi:hypothetical protein
VAEEAGRLHHQHNLDRRPQWRRRRRCSLCGLEGFRLDDHPRPGQGIRTGPDIRVNAVAPGVIATPFHERYTNDEQMEMQRKSIPMGFVGTPEDCVGAYLFLASPTLSGYVTGQIIEVNGGQLMP